jgi:chemotaxis protein CheX
MREEDLRIFIQGAARYFEKVVGESVVIDTPYEKGTEAVSEELAGVIGISGRQKGVIYFTAGRPMAIEVLEKLKVKNLDEAMEADVIGEIANTISGNARKQFGSEFLISVPLVLRGGNQAVTFPKRAPAFVIPILWRKHRCFLVIGLEENETRGK